MLPYRWLAWSGVLSERRRIAGRIDEQPLAEDRGCHRRRQRHRRGGRPRLAGDGWVVVLAGRRHEALASVAERGAELRGMLDPAPTDVTGEASVRALFDRTLQRHGRERATAVATRAATEP